MKQHLSFKAFSKALGLLVLSVCWGCPADEPKVFHQVIFPLDSNLERPSPNGRPVAITVPQGR